MSKIIYEAKINYQNHGGFIIDGVRYYSIINESIVDDSYKIGEAFEYYDIICAEFDTYEDAANWSIKELEAHLEFETNKINKSINTLKNRIKAYGKM